MAAFRVSNPLKNRKDTMSKAIALEEGLRRLGVHRSTAYKYWADPTCVDFPRPWRHRPQAKQQFFSEDAINAYIEKRDRQARGLDRAPDGDAR
jgi:predicted DNA-binding transcriptional regulator AlpA